MVSTHKLSCFGFGIWVSFATLALTLEEYVMTDLGALLRAAFKHNEMLHDAHVQAYDEHMNYGIDPDEEFDDDGYFDED